MKKITGLLNITAALLGVALIGFNSSGNGSIYEPVIECIESIDDHHTVIPCGTPFGLKMLTDGVVVTDFGAVNGRISQLSPAETAGLHKGDIVTAVNGIEITDTSSIITAVQENPENCTIDVIRENRSYTFTAKAIYSDKDEEYKLGMWTKDSCAGIGTMTFYDPENKVFAGLGHGVSDTASGTKLPLLSGEITAVTITDVIKGSNGSPGELCGAFISSTETGKITLNSEYGIFGNSDTASVLNDAIEVAHKNEVNTGKAVIYSTTGGMMPKEYEIEIVSIDYNSSSPVRNMTIKITDDELLSRTGGIVQGMSGSPIIQNGRLVGAVTHVLINDASMGYAVFAENMIYAYENEKVG